MGLLSRFGCRLRSCFRRLFCCFKPKPDLDEVFVHRLDEVFVRRFDTRTRDIGKLEKIDRAALRQSGLRLHYPIRHKDYAFSILPVEFGCDGSVKLPSKMCKVPTLDWVDSKGRRGRKVIRDCTTTQVTLRNCWGICLPEGTAVTLGYPGKDMKFIEVSAKVGKNGKVDIPSGMSRSEMHIAWEMPVSQSDEGLKKEEAIIMHTSVPVGTDGYVTPVLPDTYLDSIVSSSQDQESSDSDAEVTTKL